VINHHKVVYDQHILDKSIETLATLIFPDFDKEIALSKLFSYESYIESTQIGSHTLYLPADDDLIHLLKQYLNDNEYAQEWLSRKHRYIPLWKSRTEFLSYFGDLSQKITSTMKGKIEGVIKQIFDPRNIKYLFLDVTPKFSTINSHEIFVDVKGQLKSIKTLGMPSSNLEDDYFFYVFIPKEKGEDRDNLIREIRSDIEDILS
jgi:hypothetical protein